MSDRCSPVRCRTAHTALGPHCAPMQTCPVCPMSDCAHCAGPHCAGLRADVLPDVGLRKSAPVLTARCRTTLRSPAPMSCAGHVVVCLTAPVLPDAVRRTALRRLVLRRSRSYLVSTRIFCEPTRQTTLRRCPMQSCAGPDCTAPMSDALRQTAPMSDCAPMTDAGLHCARLRRSCLPDVGLHCAGPVCPMSDCTAPMSDVRCSPVRCPARCSPARCPAPVLPDVRCSPAPDHTAQT
jgi:hypothetical protein